VGFGMIVEIGSSRKSVESMKLCENFLNLLESYANLWGL
jgi:hypothetical protein